LLKFSNRKREDHKEGPSNFLLSDHNGSIKCSICGNKLKDNKKVASQHIFDCITDYLKKNGDNDEKILLNDEHSKECYGCDKEIGNSQNVVSIKLCAKSKDKDSILSFCAITHLKGTFGNVKKCTPTPALSKIKTKVEESIKQWKIKIGNDFKNKLFKCQQCQSDAFMCIYDFKNKKNIEKGNVCSFECFQKLLTKMHPTQSSWTGRDKENNETSKKAKTILKKVCCFLMIWTVVIIKKNKSCLFLYHIWLAHKPSNCLLNRLFQIGDSHRQKIINSLIDQCFIFVKKQDDSPLKIPSLIERKKYTAILKNPHNKKEVGITAIIDGTEQLLHKSSDFLVSLDTR